MSRVADVGVLIATCNRAALLGDTLDTLARSEAEGIAWTVTVIDNGSTDDTAAVVRRRQAAYPVPLHYCVEPRRGRSAALNHGIRSSVEPLLLTTDDDVRVAPSWLAAGARALAGAADYVGGPVRPIWQVPPPAWLDLQRADLWGTIAILDYGPEPFEFARHRRVPLGANMGFRRSLVARVGGFNESLGRTRSRQVLGQEVPELLARARAASLLGLYVPGMAVDHHVPAERLTRGYYRRWWRGKGYAKAFVDTLQPLTETGLDLRDVPHLGGVPRFMLGDAARDALAWLLAEARGDASESVRRQTRLAYLLGYCSARSWWRRPPYAARPALGDAPPLPPNAVAGS